ncbi:hypothetical protein DR62_05960 [Burkholderia thailandensis]|nr:hypothetical protein DR62_05960 [Burkholderia thailandensis]AOI50706.1 hypothetical protein WI24_02105 [Burkholderia thailandensis]
MIPLSFTLLLLQIALLLLQLLDTIFELLLLLDEGFYSGIHLLIDSRADRRITHDLFEQSVHRTFMLVNEGQLCAQPSDTRRAESRLAGRDQFLQLPC